MKKLAFLLVIANFLAACDTTAPKLTPVDRQGARQKPRVSASLLAEGPENKFDPRVDILFIVDNSKSMTKNIENVSKNIETFTRELAKSEVVDFHIAYTFVHDRSVPQFCGPNMDRPAGEKNWDDPGTLQPIAGMDATKRRFVTREDKFAEMLKNTFTEKMITPFVPVNPLTPNICARGAENEESVTPMLGALENPSLAFKETDPNFGFRRKGAKFVTIIVSDAKDAAIMDGKISLDQVLDRLAAATDSTPQERNFRVFAVTIKPGSTQIWDKVTFEKETCTPDYAYMAPIKPGAKKAQWPTSMVEITYADNPLAELARRTEDEGPERINQVLSICDTSYGKTLAQYGTRIEQDTMKDMRIKLKNFPQQFVPGSADDADKGLAVFIGEKTPENRLAPNQFKKAIIDNDFVVTILVKKIDWKAKKNLPIQIRYVPVNTGPGNPDARRI